MLSTLRSLVAKGRSGVEVFRQVGRCPDSQTDVPYVVGPTVTVPTPRRPPTSVEDTFLPPTVLCSHTLVDP